VATRTREQRLALANEILDRLRAKREREARAEAERDQQQQLTLFPVDSQRGQ
jgi:hypothetical protein